jgi:hypothetical protein
MNAILAHLMANWKTSVANLLTLIIVTGGYFAAVPTAALQQHGVSQNMIFWATIAVGVSKMYLGLIQKDAK